MSRRFFLSLREAAKRLKKTQKEVKCMVEQERLQDYRDGSRVLFLTGEVEALAKQRATLKPPRKQAARPRRCPDKYSSKTGSRRERTKRRLVVK